MYYWGQKNTPPNSYDFFLHQSASMLTDALNTQQPILDSKSSRLRQAEEIAEMLHRESYVKYYFTHYDFFSVIVYQRMRQDYRTGDYLKKDYSVEDKLKKILPSEIVSNEKAFCEFMKFVYAGWFDKETGLFLEGRAKHKIGRAIYWICKRNNIPAPDKVFASFWKVEKDTVHDWCRYKSRDPHITEQDDKEVFTIIEN